MIISVIIPVYNGEDTISECISSVQESARLSNIQTEILVINDGSTDNTKQKCEKFGRTITLINNENMGVSKTRNKGLDIAQGDYIIFVDSDDTIEKSTFSVIENIISKCDADIINFNYNVIRDGICDRISQNEQDRTAVNYEQLNEIMSVIDKAYIWNKVFKKSIIDTYHIRFCEDMSYGEDTVLLCDFLMKCKCIYVSKEYTYNYTENSQIESLSKKKYNENLTYSFLRLSDSQKMITDKYPGYGKGYIDGDTRKIIVMKTIFNMYQSDSTYSDRKQEFMKIKAASGVKNLQCDIYYGLSWRVLGTMYAKVPFWLLDVVLRLVTKLK